MSVQYISSFFFMFLARAMRRGQLVLMLLIFCFAGGVPSFVRADNPCDDCIKQEAEETQAFLVDDVFKGKVVPALQGMIEQLTAASLYQLFMVGTFFDAKNQLETQLLFQELTARAHKDYQPSVAMCKFGTNARSYVAADSYMDFTRNVLAVNGLERQLGTMNSNASEGPKEDMEGRLLTFRTLFCDPNDMGGAFKALCLKDSTGKFYSEYWPEGRNRDIDYIHTIDRPKTIDMDFSELKSDGSIRTALNNPQNGNAGIRDEIDEYAVIALRDNLYGHHVLPRVPEIFLKDKRKQPSYLNLRSLIAKRGVAMHSYNTIAAMKAKGRSLEKTTYFPPIIKQLGADAPDEQYPPGDHRFSYFEQMEYMTKRLYQDPAFYTNLYETPANVDRQYASLQAIGLMQDFDTLQSYLRTEMMLSVLVETEIDKLQDETQNRVLTMAAERGM